MLLSVGVHLIVLIHLTTLYRPNMLSRIELTIQSIKSPPQYRVVAPPVQPEQPQDRFDRQPPPLRLGRNLAITAPHYQQPEPVSTERLQTLPPLPQISDTSDPVATVWEDAPEEIKQASAAPAPSPIQQDTELAENRYIDRIKQQIDEAKEYPNRARRRNLEGVVKVLFTIGGGGELVSISISKSSGSRILDRSAIKAIEKVAPFDPPPNGSIALELPIKYQLT